LQAYVTFLINTLILKNCGCKDTLLFLPRKKTNSYLKLIRESILDFQKVAKIIFVSIFYISLYKPIKTKKWAF
jgi:hypothetical protein